MVTVSNICKSPSLSFLYEDWKTSLIFVDLCFLCRKRKWKINDGHNFKSHMVKYLGITGTMSMTVNKKYLDSNEFVRDGISLSIILDCLCSVSTNNLMIPLMILWEKTLMCRVLFKCFWRESETSLLNYIHLSQNLRGFIKEKSLCERILADYSGIWGQFGLRKAKFPLDSVRLLNVFQWCFRITSH